MYEIFTGKPLFEAAGQVESSAEWQNAITTKVLNVDTTEAIITLPPRWQPIVNQCLIKDPKVRVQSANELWELLDIKPQSVEDQLWNKAQKENTVATYKNYLERYPNGKYVSQAHRALEEIEKKVWNEAKTSNTIIAYNNYLSYYPDGLYVNEAKTLIKELDKTFIDPINDASDIEDSTKKIKWESIAIVGAIALVVGIFVYKLIPKTPKPVVKLMPFQVPFGENDLYGYKLGDSIVIPRKYMKASVFNDDRAWVVTKDSSFYINTKGDWIASSTDKDLKDQKAWNRVKNENSIAAYESYQKNYPDGKYLKEAFEIIQFLELVTPDNNGNNEVSLISYTIEDLKKKKKKKNGKWGFVHRTTGEVLIPFIYQDVGGFYDGLALAKKSDKWGFIDKAGKPITAFEYTFAEDFEEGMAAVQKNNKWGFINTKGKVVIPIQYDDVESFDDGIAEVYKNGEFFEIDKNGNIIKQELTKPIYISNEDITIEELENWITKGNNLNDLKFAAESGNKIAQRRLGKYYKNIAKKDNEAFKWFEKAAKQGDVPSMTDLGGMYQLKNTKEDDKKAFNWYKKAAKKGYAIAQNNVGAFYDNGIGTEKNDKEAFYWYTKSADQGDDVAQWNLAYFYEAGIVVNKDEKKAFELYKKSATQGNERAVRDLGFAYYNGTGVNKNITEALVWFEKSANQGDKDSQFMLGQIYENGSTDVPQNPSKAFEWYKKAAIQGDAISQFKIGLIYDTGIIPNISENDAEAFKWYKKSADQGRAEAQFVIGGFYHYGIGGALQSESKAKEYFQKSCKQGFQQACNALENFKK